LSRPKSGPSPRITRWGRRIKSFVSRDDNLDDNDDDDPNADPG
jgi:hypothetical protein